MGSVMMPTGTHASGFDGNPYDGIQPTWRQSTKAAHIMQFG